MPLTPTTPDAICDIDAVSFVMLDGEHGLLESGQNSEPQGLTPEISPNKG